MNRFHTILIVSALSLPLAALAQQGPGYGMGHGPGHGMMYGPGTSGGHGPIPGSTAGGHGPMAGPTAMLTRQDAGSRADMGLVHELLMNHARIERTVTKLPNGIRTVTESDDPATARAIQAHVASMSQRLQEGREFNIFSNTLPVLFEQRDKIASSLQMTAKGAVVTRTSTDAKVVAALQGHAGEVSELVKDGMAGFHRGMQRRMASTAGRTGTAPAAAESHAH